MNIRKLMTVLELIHEDGLDQNGIDSLKQQIPYWVKLLDEDYGTLDYPSEVTFLKGLGYRIFRNQEGKHKLTVKYTEL